jgi:hypothetical protein
MIYMGGGGSDKQLRLFPDEVPSKATRRLDGDEEVNLKASGFKYREQFGVIVICESESNQEDVYTKLYGEGYKVKVVKT